MENTLKKFDDSLKSWEEKCPIIRGITTHSQKIAMVIISTYLPPVATLLSEYAPNRKLMRLENFCVDLDIIWDIIRKDMPYLKNEIIKILDK